jgi:phage-related tail protein
MVNSVSTGTNIPKKTSSIPKVPGFASGTNFAPGGLAWVGESGPELVNLPRGSQVIPNNKAGGVNINVSIGTLVGSNGMSEFADIISRKLNKRYASAVGGGVF